MFAQVSLRPDTDTESVGSRVQPGQAQQPQQLAPLGELFLEELSFLIPCLLQGGRKEN